MPEAPSPPPLTAGAADSRPDFLVRLGVLLPCSAEDIKAAYRDKVKLAHPDHGGTAEQFRRLEEDYQSALHYAQLQTGRRAWLAAHIERYTAQEALIAEIRRRGGDVEMQSIDWLRGEVGEDFAQVLDTIKAIRLSGPAIRLKDVILLREHRSLLSGIRRLDLSGARIGNSAVSILDCFESLVDLDLSGTFVSNSSVRYLVRLPGLRHVNLGHTFFGLPGKLRLRWSRPDITVGREPTFKSAHRRRYRWVALAVVIYLALMFTGTHMPVHEIPTPRGWITPFDKIVHWSMFSLLGFLMSWLFSLRTMRGEHTAARMFFHSLIIVTMVAVYGMFDEQTQPAFGRDYDIKDWAADIVGALTGVLTFAVLRELIWRRSDDDTTSQDPISFIPGG